MADPAATVSAATRFRWQARDPENGRIEQGITAASTAHELRARLRRDGLTVEHIHPVAPLRQSDHTRGLRAAWLARRRRQRRAARADCCESLATLLEAGMPLDRALSTLAATRTRTAAERELLSTLHDAVRDGIALADVAAGQPAWFDSFDAALMRAGQDAGDLIGALRGIAEVHQRSGSLAQRLTIALAYPALLAVAALAAWIFLSLTVLPRLIALLSEAGQTPPALTVAVATWGGRLAWGWPVVGVIGVAVVSMIRFGLARSAPDSAWRQRWAATPWARFSSRARIALLAQALARLRRAGIPLADACAIAAQTLPDRHLRRVLDRATESIRNGRTLAEALAEQPGLDGDFARLVDLGEQSGDLTRLLDTLADRYRSAADRAADRLAATLGPVSLIVLAAIIAVLVLACALPLAHLGDMV